MIGGALALALAKGGLAVTLVDRTPLPAMAAMPYDGRASAVAYATHRLLAQIGLWREVEHAAEPILDIRVSDGASSLFLHYDHRDLGEALDGAPFGWIVENGAIRQGLVALLEAAPDVQVLSPARAQRLTAGDPVAELALGGRDGSGRAAGRRCGRDRFPPARPGPDRRHPVALCPERHRLHHGARSAA